MDMAVLRKRELFRISKQSRNEEDRKIYCSSEHNYESKSSEAVETVDLCCDGRELFRIAKQRAGEKRDVVGVTYFKYGSRTLKLSVDDQKKNLERAFGKVDEC